MPNSAPAGSSLTRTVPRSYTLHKSDFGFSDADGNAFKAVVVTTPPGAGTLYYDANGALGGGPTAVVAGQTISAADILAGKLTFVAPAGASGANYDHFTFRVQDDGGTAGGGVDTDPSPDTLTFDLVASSATPPVFGGLIDLASLSAANGFKIQGDAAHDQAGVSVSSAGDVNGDGFADVIVGATGNGSYIGAAYVIFGKSSGFGSLVDLTSLSAADGFKIQGEAFPDYAGFSVSSAGDVNGDGFADIIVGARYNDGGGNNAGAAYVIFGKSDGFGSTIALAGLSPTDGFKIQGEAAGDLAGDSVSSAGDINGDGFADLIVGAFDNDSGGSQAGAAYVIFGKAGEFGNLVNLTGLSADDGFKIQGDLAGDNAGFGVSSAGDVNGDGFADIVIGARGNSSGGSAAGAAYVIFGKSGGFGSLIDLTGLSAADGFKIQGEEAVDFAGRVSSAGDVNGDGFADILVGAYTNDSGGDAAGAAYVIFGKAGGFGSLIDLSTLSPADGFKIQGDAADDRAGISVSSAGDVNGDGFADIIVGAERNDSAGYNSGAAYVIFGKSVGFGSLIDLGALSAVDGFKIQGDGSAGANESAGSSVSAAGDINGDGFADLIVGAPGDRGGGAYAGAAYVIFGRANLNAAPSGSDETLTIPRSYVLHKADFGFSDTNGNAFKALVVTTLPSAGTLYYDSNGALAGGRTAVVAGQTIDGADILAGKLVYVAPVGASGANYDHFTFQVQDDGGTARGGVALDPTPNTLTFNLVANGATPTAFGGLIDLNGLSAANGFKIQGDLAGDYAGVSVSSAGDVNGDGFADLLVGAWQNDSGGSNAGAAYVIFGKASGFGSLIDLTGLSPADGFKIQGDQAGDLAGRSVASAGDINGDGFADLVVGGFNNGSSGAAYVIFGKASGFGGLIDLTFLATSDGFKIQGDFPGDSAGFSVSSAGDVNGDGFSDIIIGAPNNSSGGFGAGAAYVIFGKSGGFGSLINLNGLSANDGFKIQGDANADGAGGSVSSAGDINGDGFADIVVGARDNDSGGTNAGAAYVIFGKASGFDNVIDLPGLTAADGFKIQGDVAGDLAGFSVSSAGDVNGDGYADMIVGAIGNTSGGGSLAGAAYVIFGKADGFGSLIDLTGLSATDGFKIQGDLPGDEAGISVSSAGDVNGDGFADILVGAELNGSGGHYAGTAYVVFGKAGGFGSLIDLGNLSLADGFKIQGGAAEDAAGSSVAAAGDINGDGFDDIIVGAYTNDGGGDNAGAAYVVFGRANNEPPVAEPDAIATNEATVLNGNVLSDNGSGADSDVDGPSLTVSAVNGATAAVGHQIALASGALLTLNADGTFAYDPNHAFDATPVAGSGASNTPAHDNFTYTLTGGGTATVAVTINGIDSNDVLFGTSGADVLNGGTGADTMSGGAGNDVYYVDNAGDQVVENVGEGADRIATSVSFTLGAGSEVETIEAVTQSDTGALSLAGNEFAQTIVGNDGANLLDGGGGNDVLIGLGGNDALVGGSGDDIMYGGLGNDTYYVDSAGDQVVENAGEGTDRVAAAASFTLVAGSEVETIEAITQDDTNALSLAGNAFAQTIIGNDGANLLDGGGGNDVLVGLGGNDALVGGAGDDIMYGGLGNDTYYVDDAGDQVFENAGEGTDRIAAAASFTLAAGSEVETIEAITQADTSALNLTGNEFAQTIIGNAGANLLDGGAGNDVLIGLGGNDALVGGAGADLMYGGVGNDTYYVDNVSDQVFENVGEGSDRVAASASFTLAAGSEVETIEAITQSDTNALNLTGNGFSQLIIGNAGANVLSGGGGNDTMLGLGGDDVLIGSSSANTMYGGLGNDIYYVMDGADAVIENAGEGNDRIAAATSYTLLAGSAVETLEAITQSDTTALNFTGNGFAQTIIGNNGTNVLNGGDGNDVLVGLGGNDTFAFTTGLGPNNVDTIADFTSGGDRIALDHRVFTGLATGALDPNAFFAGTAAHDADDRIIYDSTTGNLYFDADGNGAGAAMLFATLSGHPNVIASDFSVI